jgi:hypothetical protein
MAIIVDPDNLDRDQVIYGTEPQDLSLYDVGGLANPASEGADGGTIISTTTFIATGGAFISWAIANGDILCLFTGADSRHYVINSITSETELEVYPDDTFSTFTETASGLIWAIREPTGGSIADGVTEQCVYSYTKEEWRNDTETFGGDDLIRHQFPYEPITPEQFEIGGLAAHGDWDYANLYTRNKIRTGGWRTVNTAGTAQHEYSGMISLGSMDSDAQAYYQQISSTTAPTNFAFTGGVNEAVFTWEAGDDRRTYFKAFLRKKGKTYAQYDLLTEQAITALTYKVYSFPLTHASDAAITDDDGEVVSQSPYTTTAVRTLAGAKNDGVTTAATGTFTSATAQFQTSNVQAGYDALRITSGADQAYYHILSVDSEQQLTVSVADGTFTGEAALTFDVYTPYLIDPRTDDGTLANVDSDTGTLVSGAGGFNAAGIAAGDMVVITEAASDHRGVYKVVSKDADDTLTLNTSDKAFTAVGNIDYYIIEPSMRLQYKWEDVALGATGNLTFADANPDTITRSAGSWIADGVTVGDVLVITNSVSNNGSYTVAARDATTATLVATDTLTAEGPVAATATCKRGFKRTISNVTYAFGWRMFGNSAELADCYQYTQHQLRQTTDIDHGPGTARGDITDQMLTYTFPTGATVNMVIDDLSPDDLNNITLVDATGTSRLYAYVASGTIVFNTNLRNDASAIYRMFFLNDDPPGDNLGRDYGTKDAITVLSAAEPPAAIAGNVGGAASVSFSYDYDFNAQRGAGAAGTDAPIVIIGIGLQTAQFVRFDGNITRAKGLTFSLVSALERNYSNP